MHSIKEKNIKVLKMTLFGCFVTHTSAYIDILHALSTHLLSSYMWNNRFASKLNTFLIFFPGSDILPWKSTTQYLFL